VHTPTVGMVTGLWDHMTDHYGSRVAKKDAPEMQLVGTALEKMGILDAEDFLKRYATTLGRTIYLPFEIGDGDEPGGPTTRPMPSAPRWSSTTGSTAPSRAR
jgi:hypothetical protein